MTVEPTLIDPRLALGAPIEGQPWARRVETAAVTLRCAWPAACPPRILRGAVVEQVERAIGAGVCWHNHDDNGDGAARMPEVLYRLRDGVPTVYCQGPRAAEHAAILARHAGALALPGGQVLPVEEVAVTPGATDVQRLGKAWRRYETLTPVFPSEVAYRRRPREDGPERRAWAGAYLASAIETYLIAVGLDPAASQVRLHVHVHDIDHVPVAWERPSRGTRIDWHGFHARFVANVQLPPGVGLGRHRSEGWGEVVPC